MTTPDRVRAAVLVVVLGLCALPLLQAQGRDKSAQHYALIFGTVWDEQGHAVYGAKVSIRRAGEKKPRWELYSDRNGEFAQRVPPGEADYLVRLEDTRRVAASSVAKRKFKPGEVETKVHIFNDERADISLHVPR